MKEAYSYIRFSSAIQSQGDSLRRQLEASRSYAAQHNLDLDESHIDLGVSAFTGENADEGALNKFIQLIQSGKIEHGSILIVESLDRLSRQQAMKALYLLDSIVSHGVDVVTLADGMHYTKDNINDLPNLMYSLMSISRAHEESLMKSKRGTAAWNEKRRLAAEEKRPLTRKCPNWLTVNKDMTGFIVNKKRAEIINRIFELSLSGTGQRKIATILNEEQVAPFGRSDWNTAYIRSILHSRALIGEYQPMHKKVAVGDPIKEYFPRIIEDDVFYRAQGLLKERQFSGGRRGKTFGNLFVGMCKCAKCGATYRLIKHVDTSYLTCNSHYMKTGCDNAKRWRYRFVEKAGLLVLANQIDWGEIFGVDGDQKHLIENTIQSLNEQKRQAETKKDNFAASLGSASEAVRNDARSRYETAVEDAHQIDIEIEKAQSELAAYRPAGNKLDSVYHGIAQMILQPTYENRAHFNALLKDARLQLLFGVEGVDWHAGDTAGTLLTDDEFNLIAADTVIMLALTKHFGVELTDMMFPKAG